MLESSVEEHQTTTSTVRIWPNALTTLMRVDQISFVQRLDCSLSLSLPLCYIFFKKRKKKGPHAYAVSLQPLVEAQVEGISLV